MKMYFDCPKCKTGLAVDDELAGRKAKCPQCDEVFTIPCVTSEATTKEKSSPQ